MFKLRFFETDIQYWANRYSYSENDGELRGALRTAVLKRGYLEKNEFLKICEQDFPADRRSRADQRKRARMRC